MHGHRIDWNLLLRIWRVGLPPYFLALGVTLGGGLLGGLGQWMVGRGDSDPAQIAFRIRIWAVAVAIGGTLTAFENIERGLAQLSLPKIVRDALMILAAYWGAQTAYWWLRWFTRL